MPEEPTPPPDVPTNLGGMNPEELFARGMNSVRMTTGGAGNWIPPGAEELSALFPQYEILSMLGRGGMGAVYQARQIALDRLVAIKLLPLEVSVNKDFADRFGREARAMAKLNHPNIIAVYDFGKTSEGHLYFVMEYVDGANLHEIIHKIGLDGEQALSIAGQVCTALAYAHGKGVVHRDIKPANVMIDIESHVKVADFGLARLTDPGAESWGTTLTGVVMGTPDYMAPEQKRGMHVDHRADIYSLGVMLYEMVCREVPQGIFEPPSQRAGCDARVDQIVIRAMQQAPARRYQSTQEMKADVEVARTPLPVAAPPPRAASVPLPKPPKAPPPPPQFPLPPKHLAPTVPMSFSPPARPPAKKSRAPLWIGIAAALAVVAGATAWSLRHHSNAMAKVLAKVMGEGRAGATFAAATKDEPFVNALGMKFVPVRITGGPSGGQRVLFSIWETRVQDYEAFVRETKREWLKPPFKQGPTHPAVNMSWDDAQAFCAWLTGRERKAGRLDDALRYRLPTDHEWSCAVGIGEQEDAAKSPEDKNRKINNVFPWGNAWPPPPGAGNYSGEEVAGHEELKAKDMVKEQQILTGYRDAFPFTAPVGSFPPNRFGIFDLGGNAWEWCEDIMKPGDGRRVVRGSSFSYAERSELLSSVRGPKPAALHNFNCGFRVVISGAAIDAATKDAPFVNGLGMKFVPAPITGGPGAASSVLFSVWETRVQDYEAFVKETKREWMRPRFSQGATHPVTDVSGSDAQAFCAWLTESERKAERLPAGYLYRLPSDHEWSCAVGIGGGEDPVKSPEEKNGKIANVFPWGAAWPPPPGAGNYSGGEAEGHEGMSAQAILAGYRDDFPATAPAGSFPANRFGIFDLGGNAWEWCGTPYKPGNADLVLRGGSWAESNRTVLLSSSRAHSAPGARRSDYGFRCVLARGATALSNEPTSAGAAK